MKNFMRIDAKKRQIIMDKTFYNRSLYFGTEEYNRLQMARKDYPGFTPVRREIRKPDHPIDRHKGLTYVYMENYIRKCEPAETREAEEMFFSSVFLPSSLPSRRTRSPL